MFEQRMYAAFALYWVNVDHISVISPEFRIA